jgi:putative FmdB family regulatory protein
MPLYEYQCDACGFRFEVIQRFSDPPVQSCRSCGGTVRKLLSPPAIQFKGSGWYVTDYAGKGAKSGAAEPASTGATDAKGKNGASGDAKGTSDARPGTGARTSTGSPKPE